MQDRIVGKMPQILRFIYLKNNFRKAGRFDRLFLCLNFSSGNQTGTDECKNNFHKTNKNRKVQPNYNPEINELKNWAKAKKAS